MTPETRAMFAEYIASGLRYASHDTKLTWPDDIYIITNHYTLLAELDTILAIPILVCSVPISYSFSIGFKSSHVTEYKLLNSLAEYMQLYTMEDYDV